MNVKLTLQLNKDVIEKAKTYARANNQSLSALVQNYFSFVSESQKDESVPISQNVKDLSGIIKIDEEINIKKEYEKHIMEKYS